MILCLVYSCNLSFYSGLDQLLTENRIQDLTRLYHLFSRVKDGLKELCASFSTFIKVNILLSGPFYLTIGINPILVMF